MHAHTQVILLFVSVCFDALSLILVSTSQSWKNALIAFAFLALGAGDNPTYKSVFVSSVPEEHATQALAALDMVFNIARLLSPILLGALYAVFAEQGRPELIFLVAGVSQPPGLPVCPAGLSLL
jgi:MFS family permease